jgi:acyl-CoA thioesterase
MYTIQAENGGIDKDLFALIIERINKAPSYKNLGITLLTLSTGTARVGMVAKKEFENTSTHAHGGVIAALADTAMGLSIATQGFTVVTMDMNINYLLPVNIGDSLIASAYIIKLGNNTAVAEAEVYKFQHTLVAKSQGIFTVRPVS